MFEKNKCGKNIVAKFALLTVCMYELNRFLATLKYVWLKLASFCRNKVDQN